MCAFLATPQLFFQTGNCLLCTGRGFTAAFANVYLHYVFDLWIEAWRQKVATGDVIVVRYPMTVRHERERKKD